MIGIRELGRQGLRALILLLVAATISCGGPGSAGVPNQDFNGLDTFYGGRISGRFTIAPFQVATFSFTGVQPNTFDEVFEGIVTIENDPNAPDGFPFLYSTDDQEIDGSFDDTNGAYDIFGVLDASSAPAVDPVIFDLPVGIEIAGQVGSIQEGGPFTVTLSTGETFTGTAIRGEFETGPFD